MDQQRFLQELEAVAPGHGLGLDDPIDGLRPFQRIAIWRWLCDALEHPADLEVVRQFRTLDEAWRWLSSELDHGAALRSPGTRVGPGRSTRVRLRPVLDSDLLPWYLASFDPEVVGIWRFRGRTVPIEEFLSGLSDGVRTQYVVTMIDDPSPVGVVVAYDHQQGGGHAKIGFLRFGERRRGDHAAMLEGLTLFVTHLFRSYPYRKLYIELPEANVALLEPTIFETEGILREHLFVDGRYQDLTIASLSRARWQELVDAAGGLDG